MSIVIGGIITLNYWGVCRSFALIVAHGFCSSGLFCLSNISYERFGRRSLLVNRGLINLMPRMAMWWFLLRACNMAAPPSLNLLGEIGLLSSLVSWSWCLMFVLIFFWRVNVCGFGGTCRNNRDVTRDREIFTARSMRVAYTIFSLRRTYAYLCLTRTTVTATIVMTQPCAGCIYNLFNITT